MADETIVSENGNLLINFDVRQKFLSERLKFREKNRRKENLPDYILLRSLYRTIETKYERKGKTLQHRNLATSTMEFGPK